MFPMTTAVLTVCLVACVSGGGVPQISIQNQVLTADSLKGLPSKAGHGKDTELFSTAPGMDGRRASATALGMDAIQTRINSLTIEALLAHPYLMTVDEVLRAVGKRADGMGNRSLWADTDTRVLTDCRSVYVWLV